MPQPVHFNSRYYLFFGEKKEKTWGQRSRVVDPY